MSGHTPLERELLEALLASCTYTTNGTDKSVLLTFHTSTDRERFIDEYIKACAREVIARAKAQEKSE